MSTGTMPKQSVSPATAGIGFKKAFGLGGRFVLAFVVMLVAFVVSSALISTPLQLSPEEASQAGSALLIVSLIDSLVLTYLVLRSRWYGVKLMAGVFLVHFGTQTFMSQIETLYFIGAVKMPLDMVMRVIATGFLRALIFAPVAVVLLGRLKGTPSPDNDRALVLPRAEWLKRFAILAIVYVVVYFLFGYFVAYHWAETIAYYSGTFATDWVLPVFQFLRGLMWAALALPMVKMLRGSVWPKCLAIGLTFAVLLASGVIFPNPYMPAPVRQAHFVELSSSMLTYGVIAGWVWLRKPGVPAAHV